MTTSVIRGRRPESVAYKREDGIWVFPRREFAYERLDYKPGEHFVYAGPSKRGKTQLCFDFLEAVATPELPAYIVVSKPTDEVTEKEGKRLEYRFVTDWPVPKKLNELWDGKPSGYVIWPHFGNLNTDMIRAAGITARFMEDRYTASARKEKNSAGIMVMDDTMVKAKVMRLDGQMVTILAMAGAMKIGLWVFIQKPTDSGRTTLWAYENGDHFAIAKGGDSNMLKRYTEIAGEHGPIVKAVLPTLERYQFLYFHRAEGYICIVDAS